MADSIVRVDADDASAVTAALEVVRASEIRTRGRADTTQESLRAQLASPEAVPDETWLALEDAQAVGLLVLERSPGSDAVYLDVHVAGDAPRAVGARLLAHGIDRVRGLVGYARVQSAAGGDDGELRASLAAAGLTEIRRYWRMRRDLTGVDGREPAPPDGVVRRVVAGDDDMRVLHGLREETFRGSDGFESRTFEEYEAILDAVAGADRDGRWIATLHGRPVALCIVDDWLAAQGDAYLRTVGVVHDARGRGIARWLLDCAAAYSARRGRGGIVLTVNGANATGATDLYLAAGYEVVEVIDLWECGVANARARADSR
jgi:mycothiol synthase